MSAYVLGALKAIVAGLISGISFLIPVIDDGLKGSEILGAALALLVGLGTVYYTPNLTKSGRAVDQPPPG